MKLSKKLRKNMNMIFDQDPGFVSAVKEYFDQRILNLYNLHKMSKQDNDKYHFEILLLACCYIDALASIFTDERKINERFIEILFLLGTTNNIDFSKINLVFLQGQIRGATRDGILLPQKYSEFVSDEINRRDYSVGDNTEYDLTKDVMIGKLLALSTEDEINMYGDIIKEKIRKSSYAGVLYENYRNLAVHEAQVRGHWSTGSEDKPFYMDIIDGSAELSFPPLFLIKVFENLLARTYERCEELFLRNEFGE